MSFHVGQKVVCIKTNDWEVVEGLANPYARHHPRRGQVYTIIDIRLTEAEGTYLRLSECGIWDCYFAGRFRPVKTTDISLFTQMLAPYPKTKVRA